MVFALMFCVKVEHGQFGRDELHSELGVDTLGNGAASVAWPCSQGAKCIDVVGYIE